VDWPIIPVGIEGTTIVTSKETKGNSSDEIRAKGPKKEFSTDAALIPGRGLALAQASLYRRHDRPGLFTQVRRITQERKTMLAKTRQSQESNVRPF
jgi:hypothetical protein